MKQRILVVDPDRALCELLSHFLGEAGFSVSTLHTCGQLPIDVRSTLPDLVLMERRFADLDGFAALKQLRGHGDTTPVIILSSLADAIDRVIGLELGADDYLAKPFVPSELLARVRAVLRRMPRITSGEAPRAVAKELSFGPFHIVYATRTLLKDGVPLRITESQFALLALLTQRPMQTLSRAQLVALTRGGIRENSVNVAMSRLRAVLEVDPDHPGWIRTLRGEGYQFVPDVRGDGGQAGGMAESVERSDS
ncbi:response regulator transcription factor [Paraburkholderia sp. J67]|uniref:response regulator transcription factor n=1 Tax=Paraburkholderia sp. J67 TaxID=2805435 RepID=UPI002ABD4EC3|nr:response regulator transcription factor [Paraburkholderia sp. J67]